MTSTGYRILSNSDAAEIDFKNYISVEYFMKFQKKLWLSCFPAVFCRKIRQMLNTVKQYFSAELRTESSENRFLRTMCERLYRRNVARFYAPSSRATAGRVGLVILPAGNPSTNRPCAAVRRVQKLNLQATHVLGDFIHCFFVFCSQIRNRRNAQRNVICSLIDLL